MTEHSVGDEELSSSLTVFEENPKAIIPSLDDVQDVKNPRPKRVDVCKLCFKTFTNSSNYKYHMAHHSDNCDWHCNECPKSYKTKADLQRHQQVHLKTHGSFHCKTCGQFFGILSDFNSHRKTHTKVTQKNVQTKCDICDKMFNDLKSHNRSVHLKIREHICTICFKAFGKKSGLDRHITTVHDKMRFWGCDLCEKRFGEKTLLTRHRKIHFKPIFPAASDLDNEITENAEDQEIVIKDKKRMRCGLCKKVLNSRGALKRHKLLVHEKKQNLLCDFCPKLFGERSNLSRHIRRVHTKEVDLVSTEQTEIKNESNGANISKNENYSCLSCDKTLTTKWGFKSHQEICRIKQQQKFNDEQNDDQKDEKVGQNEEDEKDKNHSDKVLEDKNGNEDRVDNELTNLVRMEQIFLVAEEVETIDVKEEEIVVDENTSNKISVQFDPEEASDRVVASHCLTVKVEPKDNDIHLDDSKPTETLPEVEDSESGHDDVFNDNSSSDYKSKYDSEDESNDSKMILQSSSIECSGLHLRNDEDKKCGQDDVDDDETGRTCDRCDPPKVFQNKNCLHRHSKTVHSGQTYTCSQCDRIFSAKTSLARHIKSIHANIRNYKCEEKDCGKCFVNKCDLEQHLNGSHNKGDKSLRTCTVCLKTFKNAKYLKTHVSSVHNNDGQLSCPICNQTFSFQRSMVRHIQAVHENRKDFKCTNDNCLREFRSRYELNEHFKNVHVKDVNVESLTCNICEKIFSSRKTLYGHKKMVHEGVRWKVKYQCRLCKEVFKTKYNKNKHWHQVHHNGKLTSRSCFCGSNFKLFDEFKEHIDSHVGSFICIICGTNFPEEFSLYIHMEGHKKIEEELRLFVCDICSHRLSTKSQLSIHMRKHFSGDHYVCDVCGKSYKFIAPFLYHKKGHQNQLDFPCRYCKKQFRISRDRMLHERSHTGEKPYKCRQCSKAFAQKAIYHNHLKTHEVKGYNCKTCGLQFSSELKLRQHVDTEHPGERPLRCCNCSKSFKVSKALEVHKQKCETLRDTELIDMKAMYV